MFDALGCLKIDKQINKFGYNLHLDDLNPGIYILELEVKDKWHSKKLVVY